jgi:hypothetical protein
MRDTEARVPAKYARHPIETYTDALRTLAKSNDINRSTYRHDGNR